MQVLAANTRRAIGSRVARGLTLIETMICLSVVGILAGTAVPSFDQYQKRRALDGAAAEVLTDLHFARSEAISRNQRVRVSYLGAADGGRCVIVHTGKAADCACGAQGAAQCAAGVSVLKATSFVAGAPVAVTSNVEHMVIDPVRGTFSLAGQVRTALADGTEVRHVVTPHGRIRSCSPNGKVKGYATC
jgi:type IV fimbrial biogenesis protein FimT